MKRYLSFFAVVLLVALPAAADAPQTGLVTGVVTGSDGEVLPGVTIQLTGDQGTMTAISKEDGSFRFVFLLPGTYTVRADMSGFQPAAGEIVVSAGGRAQVDLRLSAAMGEEILVTGESPLVNKFDMSSGGTLDSKELQAITGQGQQYRSRLLFLPDVINEEVSDGAGGNRPTIAGLTGSRQMYFIDGVDVSFARWGGGSQVNIPASAVGEMKLESTGADAQFSRSIGAYTQTIVRSGSNDFHGSGFYQMQNLAWDGTNKNVDVDNPDDLADGFDFSIGGPIVRDKLWFYLGYRDIAQPGLESMAGGTDVVETGSQSGSQLAKLDWRPNASHSVALMYVLTPSEFPWWNRATYGFEETVAAFDYPGDITTLRWNFAMTDSLLLTVHAAKTTAEQNRVTWAESPMGSGCDGSTPCGNDWLYRPLDGDKLFRNGFGLPLGVGYTEFPRDQFNAAVDVFAGVHEIKAGLDYQTMEWNSAGTSPPFCRGRGYGFETPGGFASNESTVPAQLGWCRFFPTKATWMDGWGPASSGSDNVALFVRDKIALNRWTFNLGLRADQQHHENDVGKTVIDSTDIAPRVGFSYDLKGDSTLLLQGTAGRYYAQVEMAWTAAFNEIPQGRLQYEQYRWDPATQDYTNLFRVVGGGDVRQPEPIDPYYKDEVSLGLEWQFHQNWAFKAVASAWEANEFPQIYNQIEADGVTLVEVIENTPGAYSERQALSLSVQRRFRNNWMMAASYVYSKTEGNCWYLDNGQCISNYGELLSFTNDEGTPWSYVNRFGPLRQDRPHNFKLRGSYNWQLGKGHTLLFGGLAYYNDGPSWYPWRAITDPVSGASTTEFLELRGSRRIGGRGQLDFNAQWSFPIAGQFNGWLRAEILNIFDQQDQIGLAGMAQTCFWADGDCTGTPTPSPTNQNFQYPRKIRIQVGFSF